MNMNVTQNHASQFKLIFSLSYHHVLIIQTKPKTFKSQIQKFSNQPWNHKTQNFNVFSKEPNRVFKFFFFSSQEILAWWCSWARSAKDFSDSQGVFANFSKKMKQEHPQLTYLEPIKLPPPNIPNPWITTNQNYVVLWDLMMAFVWMWIEGLHWEWDGSWGTWLKNWNYKDENKNNTNLKGVIYNSKRKYWNYKDKSKNKNKKNLKWVIYNLERKK